MIPLQRSGLYGNESGRLSPDQLVHPFCRGFFYLQLSVLTSFILELGEVKLKAYICFTHSLL
jgi:hypothetical protein